MPVELSKGYDVDIGVKQGLALSILISKKKIQYISQLR
jgi:hypothetical protein